MGMLCFSGGCCGSLGMGFGGSIIGCSGAIGGIWELRYVEKEVLVKYTCYWKETASQKIIVIFVYRPQLLILCNKQDLGTAKGATLIQVSLLDYSQKSKHLLIFFNYFSLKGKPL
jgi:hypothetical protein